MQHNIFGKKKLRKKNRKQILYNLSQIMSSKDLTFDAGIEHQFPVGLSIKKIKENDVFYLSWKDNFKKSITKCVKKLLKDIKAFESLIHYIHNYELNKKAVKEIYDFDEIKELIYLVNSQYMLLGI